MKKMKKKTRRILIWTLAILLVLVGLGIYGWESETKQNKTKSNLSESKVQPSAGLAGLVEKKGLANDTKVEPVEPSAPTSASNAKIVVNGSEYDIFADGESLYEIMKNLSEQNPQKFYFKTKTYGGLGEYVDEINGIAPPVGKYWIFYVNGDMSDVGISTFVPKEGDLIEWKIN